MNIDLEQYNNEDLFKFVKEHNLRIKVLLSSREFPTLNLITIKKYDCDYKIVDTFYSDKYDYYFPLSERFISMDADGKWVNKEPSRNTLDDDFSSDELSIKAVRYLMEQHYTGFPINNKRIKKIKKYKDCYDFEQFRQIARVYSFLLKQRQQKLFFYLERDHYYNKKVLLLREQYKNDLKINKKYCYLENKVLNFSIDKYLDYNKNFFKALQENCVHVNLKNNYEENIYIYGTFVLFGEEIGTIGIYDAFLYSSIILAYMNLLPPTGNNPIKRDFYNKIKEVINNTEKKELKNKLESIEKLTLTSDNIHLSYFFYPEIFIVHEIDNDNKLIRRFIEIHEIYYSDIYRRLITFFNINLTQKDDYNENEIKIGNGYEIFGNINDTFINFELSDKIFFQIPLKNNKNLRSLSSIINNYLVDCFDKVDTKKIQSSKEKDYFSRKLRPGDTFWKVADTDTKTIVSFMMTGALGYPRKKITEIISEYGIQDDYANFYKNLSRLKKNQHFKNYLECDIKLFKSH